MYRRIISMNRALVFLIVTNGLIFLAEAMVGPMYALFVREVGGSFISAGIAGAVFAFVAGIATLVSGKLSDRIRRHRLFIVAGYVIIGIGFALYMLVDTFNELLMVEVLIAIGQAVYGPPFSALYTTYVDAHTSASQWSIWEALTYFTTAVGAFLGGVLVSHFGFNVLFATMSSVAFASACGVLFIPRDITKKARVKLAPALSQERI